MLIRYAAGKAALMKRRLFRGGTVGGARTAGAWQITARVSRAAADDPYYSRMRPSPWKRRLVAAIRWSLLVDALVSASAALLTIVPWPVWTPAMGGAWPVGMVVPEIALWLVPLPVCFAAAALWLGRRSRRWLTGITVALCAAA